MGKTSKLTSGVFLGITGNSEKKSLYDVFLKSGPSNPSRDLVKYTNKYEQLVNDNKITLNDMSLLEELIIQLRCKENIPQIKLSILRDNYIYAIAPFFRKETSGKDIRVLIGKTEFEGSNLNELYMNKKFMDNCNDKLIEVMDAVIKSNKKIIQSIF